MIGISVDSAETLKRFKKETGAQFALLSDEGGKVAKEYVGLMPVIGLANRANIVVGQDGIVKEVVTGSAAIDPSAAVNACPSAKAGGA